MHTGLLHFSSVHTIISESCLLNRRILAVINDTASLHDSARNTHLMHWHHAVSYHWGEPERAPLSQYNGRNVYIYIYMYIYMYVYVTVRHSVYMRIFVI